MTVRMLATVAGERTVRETPDRLARDQAALHRVATLVAQATPPEELFSRGP